MADNGGANPFNNGDILGVISGDITLIHDDTSNIRDNTDLLHSINQNISYILQQSSRWSQQDVRSRIYDTARNSNNNIYDRRPGNNSRRDTNRNNQDDDRNNRNKDNRNRSNKSFNKKKSEGFIDSFFGQLERDMLGSNFKGAVQKSMKDFANALGVEFDGIPSLFGKTLAAGFKNTALGKDISNKIQSSLGNTLDNTLGRMESGMEGYFNAKVAQGQMTQEEADAQRDQVSELMSRIKGNFSNSRTDANNDPTPHPENPNPHLDPTDSQQNNAGNNDADESEQTKILENKLDYLYPINNTLNVISEGVSIIAKYITDGDDSVADMMQQYAENQSDAEKDNSGFIDNLINGTGEGQGSGGDAGGELLNLLTTEGPKIFTEFMEGGILDAGAAMAGLATAALPAIAGIITLNVATALAKKALERFKACFAPLQESFKELKETLSKVTNRYFESERKKIKDQTSRILADTEVMIKTPFEIMEKAANEWYDAWDNNLKTINATQGYTKADLQNLMASYAERLRSEGLGQVVSAADISSNLAKVLESGLSGKAAEEFAYLATVLENAMPTEDFFSYASIYGSIAANQMLAGKSQSEALAAANAQLKQFASNVLYSSRQLAGGFSTGLTNASSLLESAVKIANTAGIADSSMISGVLTSISATVGAIAPDLAGSITDAIIDAALGGNSDELVALRSQAGTGASNTAFLNAFARDPKGVLKTLFSNLSNLQSLNKDNFMEVAESLSSTFGLSIGAFTRIDFDDIADAISNMDVNMKSIESNMHILEDGQTTTTAEQLKMQKINEMILNEGLSYVIDNDAARSIQEHMWQQEIAAEMQEAEYSVDLTGKSLEFLSSIKETINNILNFLNPFKWLKDIANVTETFAENFAMKSDIKSMLEAGKVGEGNKQSLYNLTTYDVDKLTNKPGNLLQMMGGISAYSILKGVATPFRTGLAGYSLFDWAGSKLNGLLKGGYGGTSGNGSYNSKYDWKFISKSASTAIGNTSSKYAAYTPGNSYSGVIDSNSDSIQDTVTGKSKANLMDYLNTMEAAVKKNKSFEEWEASSKDYGIVDLSSAIGTYGITREQLEGKFNEYESTRGSEYNYTQDQNQQAYWDRVTRFFDEDFVIALEQVTTKMDRQIELLTNIDITLTTFLTSWTTDWLQTAWSVDWLQNAWQTDWIDTAWTKNWLVDAWYSAWIDKAWNTDWLQDAWYTAWIKEAWFGGWIDAWRTEWIEQAWNNSWLTEAWGNQWIKTAWNESWIQTQWQKNWLQDAWLEAWINKAWNQNWLQTQWNQNWLQTQWNQNWLQTAWQKNWIQTQWKQNWLVTNWKERWIDKNWRDLWITKYWKEKWLETAWNKNWLKEAWTKEWLETRWDEKWIKNRWDKEWIKDIVKSMWGNRWWEFFNIFKDRFGGITTADTKLGDDGGKKTINTKNIYTIYQSETGGAVASALKDVRNQEKSETGDAVLALAKQLTKNSVELRDPQVQTNVLLSQILIVLEAIMQAENVSGGASLATTLMALGMGAIQPNLTENAASAVSRLTSAAASKAPVSKVTNTTTTNNKSNKSTSKSNTTKASNARKSTSGVANQLKKV